MHTPEIPCSPIDELRTNCIWGVFDCCKAKTSEPNADFKLEGLSTIAQACTELPGVLRGGGGGAGGAALPARPETS